jgi:hypothetical protein
MRRNQMDLIDLILLFTWFICIHDALRNQTIRTSNEMIYSTIQQKFIYRTIGTWKQLIQHKQAQKLHTIKIEIKIQSTFFNYFLEIQQTNYATKK